MMERADRVRVAAHAKVNLLLRILAAERAGMHQIETVFALLELSDEILVTRTSAAGEVRLDVRGADTGPAEENLAVRAARAVLEATGERFGVHIQLEKRIPIRAGLGGGSSDAGATLHAVNQLANGAVPQPELLHFATRLGADVAFFASRAPLALAWGHGERLFHTPAPPAAPALVAVPRVAVSTADAYRWWDEASGGNSGGPTRGALVLDPAAFATWGSVGRLGGNDFETVVFGHHPRIRELFERVAGTRPYWVRMCGSGSAVAAVYATERLRDDAALELGTSHQALLRTATRAALAPAPVPY
ncbi:MAG TPA: 4-(cytidine 5'-diphospho)-2-C-methyl-D-erythritol kinase [Gemmatimonadales bacterium]|nr:4-(cytidine 5'-diphospho)-2-C-methyl-D-erythritol kinase [Gemmatimonadales bacterium]